MPASRSAWRRPAYSAIAPPCEKPARTIRAARQRPCLFPGDQRLDLPLRLAHAGDIGAVVQVGGADVVPGAHAHAVVDRHRPHRRVRKHKTHGQRRRQPQLGNDRNEIVAVGAEPVQPDHAGRRAGAVSSSTRKKDRSMRAARPWAEAGILPGGVAIRRCRAKRHDCCGNRPVKRRKRAYNPRLETAAATRSPDRGGGPYPVTARSQRHNFCGASPMASAATALRCATFPSTTSTQLESGRVYPDRRSGARPPADPAAAARRAAGLNTAGFVSGYRGSPLGGLDQSLWKAAEVPRARAHQVPAGTERGSRRDGDLGQPAGQPVPGRQVRRRVLDVVRQGPGRRPLRRRVQARQLRGHVEARRRAGARRRRSRGQVVDLAAPVGSPVLRGDDAGALSVVGAGDHRPRPARLGDEPLLGPAGSASNASSDTVESSASVTIDPGSQSRS